MVFYTCSGCGESLKKNKVDKHVSFCHACQYLTCMDCNKDFWGDDYLNHATCISEEERYSASGYQSKPNKGELKQKEWIKKIEMVIQDSKNMSHQAILLLRRLQEFGNIPRKRAKFLNFLKNSLKVRDGALTEEVWNAFSTSSKPIDVKTELESKDVLMPEEKENASCDNVEKVIQLADGDECNETRRKKETKRNKRKPDEQIKIEDNKKRKILDSSQGKFPWAKSIRSCLTSKGGEMSITRLKKKVIKEWDFFQANNQSSDRKRKLSDSQLTLLFNKKIHKDSRLRVVKNKVQLCS